MKTAWTALLLLVSGAAAWAHDEKFSSSRVDVKDDAVVWSVDVSVQAIGTVLPLPANPLTLVEATDLAMRNSPSTRSAWAQVRETEAAETMPLPPDFQKIRGFTLFPDTLQSRPIYAKAFTNHQIGELGYYLDGNSISLGPFQLTDEDRVQRLLLWCGGVAAAQSRSAAAHARHEAHPSGGAAAGERLSGAGRLRGARRRVVWAVTAVAPGRAERAVGKSGAAD